MIEKSKIISLLHNYLKEQQQLFLVDVKTTPNNKIKVIIDNKERLTLEDCVALSKWLDRQLDRDIEDFELEVSSAGIGSPFKVWEQYKKAVGKQVDVNCKNGEKHIGLLKDLQDNAIILIKEKQVVVEGKNKKRSMEKLETILLEDIINTKEIITF